MAALLFAAGLTRTALHAAQDASTPPTSLTHALPDNPTGKDIYTFACSTCHGVDGTGSPQSVVGFALPLPNGHDFPDFTDCPTNTVEPFADWVAVATRGGPIRGLDRHMPAFGDALSQEQIGMAVQHLWSFCDDSSWPRGDLNLPRAIFTEKAFPENETVLTTSLGGSDARAISHKLVYEHRIGSRMWYEVVLPFGAQQAAPGGAWNRGLGDIALALRRTLYANTDRGTIVAAGGELVLPTGKESEGLGEGRRVYEPLALFGQMLRANGFLQMYGGYEFSSDTKKGPHESFLRSALGYTVAEDHGFGRTWTPMTEVLFAKERGGPNEWDMVPQMQVSLSKLQHVLLDVGVRLPLSQRETRKPQVIAYVLWDWFDGGFFQFWK